jgi:hypothetical protein
MADVFWPRGDHDYFSGCHLSTLDDPALAAALGAAHTRMPGPLCHLQLHHLGGAVARDPETSAFAGRGAPWMFTAAARWPDVAHTGPHLEWARSARAAVEPWATGRTYVNFLPESGHAEAAYDTDRLRRLTALKDRLDPANLFRLNQNIRPTEQQSGG